jgi:hypothetical protein
MAIGILLTVLNDLGSKLIHQFTFKEQVGLNDNGIAGFLLSHRNSGLLKELIDGGFASCEKSSQDPFGRSLRIRQMGKLSHVFEGL